MRWKLRASLLFGMGVFFSVGVLFAPLALSATTPAAIKLEFASTSNPTNPIFVYKRVKNPVATATTGCPSAPDSSTVQCYVWKQVGFLAAHSSAYVFIDPPGTQDAYGKPVVYKLAQAKIKSTNNTVTKWTSLCLLKPNKLKSEGAANCGTVTGYISYASPASGKNYAVGTITPNDDHSIGIDYSLNLPTFYNAPKGRASVPLTFWTVFPTYNEPTGLYEYNTSPSVSGSAPYIPVAIATTQGAPLQIKYYTSKLKISSSGNIVSWVQRKYAVGAPTSPLVGTPNSFPGYIGAFKSQALDTKISLTSTKGDYYGTYKRLLFPNKPTYCVDNNGNVKLYSASTGLPLAKSSASYTCPLSTGYNLQLESYTRTQSKIKTLSDLYVFRSLGNNYVTWKTNAGNAKKYTLKVAGTTITCTSGLPCKINKELSTYQSGVNYVSVAPTKNSSPASGSKPYILRTSFTAGPVTQPQAPAYGFIQYWSVTPTSIAFNSYHLLSVPNLTATGYVCKSSAAPPCLNRPHHYESLKEVENKVRYSGLTPDTKYTFSLKVSEVSQRYNFTNIGTSKATLHQPTNIAAMVTYSVTPNTVALTWDNATVTPQPNGRNVQNVTITPSLPAISGTTVTHSPNCSSAGSCKATLTAAGGVGYQFMPQGNVTPNWIAPTSVNAAPIAVPVYKITQPTNFSQAAGATATTAKLNWSGGKLSPTPTAAFHDGVTTVVKACSKNHTTHKTSTSLTCSEPMILGGSDGSFSGLAPGTKYNVLVAVSGNVSSGPTYRVSTSGQPESQSGVGTFKTNNYVMTTPPANVTLVSKTVTTANIKWTAAQDTPTNPNITYTAVATPTPGQAVTQAVNGVVTNSGKGTQASFTGLGVDTTYSVKVTADDHVGNTKSVTKNNLFTTDKSVVTAGTVTVTLGTPGTANVSWAKATDTYPDATFTYKVTTSPTATVTMGTGRTATLTNLKPNTSYHVTVKATDNYQSSDSKTIRTQKTPASVVTIKRVKVTNNRGTTVQIRWEKATDTYPNPEITYSVTFTKNTKTPYATIKHRPPSSRTAKLSGLETNVTYTVKVKATDRFGASKAASVTFTTRPY